MRVLHVVGARPNFMKAAPVVRSLGERQVEQTLVHTGQHYDDNMSSVFFRQLGLPDPDINLDVGPGTHASQTARILERLEPVILDCVPDIVLVYGDVNSTLAGALACSKLQVPIGHVEAGLRSFDRAMPEEINRIVTDRLSAKLFTHSEEATSNLLSEGEPSEEIYFVGNTMIDTVVRLLPDAEERGARLREQLGVEKYVLVTLHRPSTVDNTGRLRKIMGALEEIADEVPVLFPVHPRTRKVIVDHELTGGRSGLHLIDPLGYLDFLALEAGALVAITDSGGVQEETTFLGVPCLTMRENTERPVTVTAGTNTLIGYDTDALRQHVFEVLAGRGKSGVTPPLWDGRAGERIAGEIA